MKIVKDIDNGKLQSAYAIGDFRQTKENLASEDYRIISLEEQSRLRIQSSINADISTFGNWVREGVIYVPRKGVFLTKNSPIMDEQPKRRIKASDGIFYINRSQVESALAGSVKLAGGEIPTNRFGEDERTVFAFGENAEPYGKFLRRNEIKSLPVFIANLREKPFTTQIWFGSVNKEHRSEFLGSWNYNISRHSIRGVCDRVRGIR
ncbi:MAG TPA: hypothetical protein VI544_01970 [Candidatus Nanoarchaeia archaeon]|nr:hypothetical protein [Candidatus Nanoarchaeia archaeon]